MTNPMGALPLRPPLITLTSDFGLSDPYVGIVHGVILGKCPEARLIDLTHAVPPQSIEAGAFTLLQAYRAFPRNTIHWAVVDPGVGTARRGVLVRAAGAWWVGPDNGLFSFVLDHEPLEGAWVLDHPEHWRHPVSATFHGRDIFAPVAALLARGMPPESLGTPNTRPLVRLPPLEGTVHPDGSVRGRVVWVDHFGNLTTSLRASEWQDHRHGGIKIAGRWAPLVRTYGDAPDTPLIALTGSGGFLEVAVPHGSAARSLGTGVGAVVELV